MTKTRATDMEQAAILAIQKNPEWVVPLTDDTPFFEQKDWQSAAGFPADQDVVTLQDGREVPLEAIYGAAMRQAVADYGLACFEPYTCALRELKPSLDPEARVYFVDTQSPSNDLMKVKAGIIEGKKVRSGTIVTMNIDKDWFRQWCEKQIKPEADPNIEMGM